MTKKLKSYQHQITKHHLAAQNRAKQAIEHALKAGKLLNEAKGRVVHGEWLTFLESAKIKPRTAQRYMRLVTNKNRLKCDTVSHLSVSKALKYLAEPERKPPTVGEYLYSNTNNAETWVWCYEADFYHYITNTPESEGCSVAGSFRPMKWQAIIIAIPGINHMQTINGTPHQAYVYREALFNQDLSFGNSYNPQKPMEYPNTAMTH